MSSRPTLSVITVTLNCATRLERLVHSLLAQDDQDFAWTVVDGGSTDETLRVIDQFPSPRLTMRSEPDFGIYDALNRAVEICPGDYYLVVGSDDELLPHTIANYRKAAEQSGADIIAAEVTTGDRLLLPMRGKRWLRGGNAFVASHAVGSLIRKDLHKRYGYYSNRYVNCADMYFVLSSVIKGNARIAPANFVAGRFAPGGISSADAVCSLSDAFRIQLQFGGSKFLQFSLYVARLIRVLWFRRAS